MSTSKKECCNRIYETQLAYRATSDTVAMAVTAILMIRMCTAVSVHSHYVSSTRHSFFLRTDD